MRTFGYVVWMLFSLLMIVSGVIGCFMPIETFMGFVVLLPLFFLVGGVGNILYYFYIREVSGAGFVLADGLLNLLFALILFAGGIGVTTTFVVMFVVFMTMFKGVLGLGYAFELKKMGVSWVWALVFSLLNILISVVFIVNPVIGGITIGMMLSLLVLFIGITSLSLCFSSRKLFG